MSQVDAKTLAKTLVSDPVKALIFDMDGTMIDSMPYHARSWVAFAQQHGLDIELDDLMRRTTGRNGLECMRELFQSDMDPAQAWSLIKQKEQLYRELFAPVFSEVAGFKAFLQQAHAAGLKVGVGRGIGVGTELTAGGFRPCRYGFTVQGFR